MNPNKCVFGVPSGQLLRFLVSHRGIEASTKQIRAITEMGPPRSIKDVQKLTGCMAALNRFISRLGEKGLPFFKLLKKTDKFEWTEEANEAFKKLKAYLTVGVLDRRTINQLVNLYCVFLIPDGNAKRHKVYTSSGNGCPTSSLRDRSCIPCTEMLVVGGYKQGERGSWS